MVIADAFIGEMDQEVGTTRRVLERVPSDKLAWKPHEKSMSLGQLAMHVATVPGFVARLAVQNPGAFPENFEQPSAQSTEEVLSALDESVGQAKQIVGGFDDAAMMETWSLDAGGKTMMSMPRVGLLRAIMLNHWYHHRGQLSVYLRLLDVPVPSIYGPSADENPFA